MQTAVDSGIYVRRADWFRGRDAQRIASFRCGPWLKRFTPESLNDARLAPRTYFFVADGAESSGFGPPVPVPCVGYSVVEHHEQTLVLSRIVVADPWRGCGVGTALMQNFLSELRRKGPYFRGLCHVPVEQLDTLVWLRRFGAGDVREEGEMIRFTWCGEE